MMRGALVALLAPERDLKVVAKVGRGDMVLPTARQCQPDVAVIDIDLPVVDGLAVAEMLQKELPGCRTLILTRLDRPAALRRALCAHVSGFLLKDSPSERLAEAIRAVASGLRVIDPHLALAAWDIGENPLSEREIQILHLAAQGDEAAEIAADLYLSVGTVRNYLTTIVMKLNARTRLDAVRIANEAGWVP
jgi:two-component system response regulator DesR